MSKLHPMVEQVFTSLYAPGDVNRTRAAMWGRYMYWAQMLSQMHYAGDIDLQDVFKAERYAHFATYKCPG